MNDDVNDVGRHTIPLPPVVVAPCCGRRCAHCTKVTRLGSSCGSSAARGQVLGDKMGDGLMRRRLINYGMSWPWPLAGKCGNCSEIKKSKKSKQLWKIYTEVSGIK